MQKAVVNKQTIALIASAIEITGLVGLDRLFSFMIVTDLRKVFGMYLCKKKKNYFALIRVHLVDIFENKTRNPSWDNIIPQVVKELSSIDSNQNIIKVYQGWVNRSQKLFANVMDTILSIGQLQLLRNLMAFHLNTSCKFNAKNLESSLQSLNK